MGMRTGDWVKYDQNGVVLLVIAYQNGIEKRYDGIKITPEYDE
jgi:antitoxin component YwqK of YwqJK toxin-antitoxin module